MCNKSRDTNPIEIEFLESWKDRLLFPKVKTVICLLVGLLHHSPVLILTEHDAWKMHYI